MVVLLGNFFYYLLSNDLWVRSIVDFGVGDCIVVLVVGVLV